MFARRRNWWWADHSGQPAAHKARHALDDDERQAKRAMWPAFGPPTGRDLDRIATVRDSGATDSTLPLPGRSYGSQPSTAATAAGS